MVNIEKKEDGIEDEKQAVRYEKKI